MSDLIDRQAAIDAIHTLCDSIEEDNYYAYVWKDNPHIDSIVNTLENLPSVAAKLCEYYALCRHGRDENKLRARLGFCEYCNEDSDGYVKPIEKNNNAFICFGMNGWELRLKANGWHGSAKIRYCPMCGRDLLVK